MYLLNEHVHSFCQHFYLFFCMIERDRTACFPVSNVWFSRGFGTVLSQEILPAHLSSGRTWMRSRSLLLFCSCRRSVTHSHDSWNRFPSKTLLEKLKNTLTRIEENWVVSEYIRIVVSTVRALKLFSPQKSDFNMKLRTNQIRPGIREVC